MGKKILVVDDDEDTRKVLVSFLSSQGHAVSTASDGAEGWERAQAEQPDVLILDVDMPVMTGLEVLQKVREHPEMKELPVILLTGKDQDSEILGGYSSGADLYVTKPFQLPALLSGIERMLAEGKQT